MNLLDKLTTSKETDLGSEPMGRLLATLAVPAIASQIVNALYNMVDRMYIGHIPETGPMALTGLGVCFPLIMIVSAFACLVGMGGAPKASIYMGRRDNAHAEKILGNCTTALVFLSVTLTVLVLLFKRPLLYLFGASENTIEYAESYMTIYALGTVFVQLTLGLNSFISAQGFSKISMFTVIIGAVTNIILDPILIFGFGMGVRGAALATVISQALSALWALKFLTGNVTVLRIKKKYLKVERHILSPCLALGVAPFIMQSTESLLVLCFNSSLLKYGGDTAVGAMTILSSVMQFALLPLQGLTQGGQPIISFNYGALGAGAYGPVRVGSQNIHGVGFPHGRSKRLSAELHRPRQRKGLHLPCNFQEDNPAHTSHIHTFSLFHRQSLCGISRRARRRRRRRCNHLHHVQHRIQEADEKAVIKSIRCCCGVMLYKATGSNILAMSN